MIDLGWVPASTTLYIPFASYGADGQSLTLTGLAVTDIEIYKNGSVTQRASDNGYALLDTDGIDFDSITGLHGFSIDLSDNSDSGFYSVGGQYWVVVSSVTINSQTVSFIAATFRIRPAESQTGYPKTDAQYIEGTDATDQIRDSIVDDATRIDASALNTASVTTIPAILDDTDLIDDGTSGLAKIATDVAAVLVDTAEIGAAGAGLTAIPWNASWDAEVESEVNDGLTAFWTSPATLVDLVWDEVLTGATHNVATSAGRRLRGVQDNQAYDDGAIWIDTVNGTPGTTVYENGTAGNPVSTLADALTLATAANVKHLHIVNGSTITLASTVDNFEMTGDEWGIALGAQSCNGLSIHNAHLSGVGVSGTFTGNPHILHSAVGAITGPNARIGWCAILGAVTSNSTGTWVIHSCWGLSGAIFDFGAGAGQSVYILDWVGGPIEIRNMAASDVLYFEGRSGALTLAASCTAGTVYLAGDIALTNSGSGQTINQTSRYEITRILSDSTAFAGADIAAILVDTAEIGTAGAGLTDLGGMSTGMKAEVNTEVLDVLNVDTFAQPGQESPAATTTLRLMLAYLYKAFRNKSTQTATTYSLYADDTTTVDQKSTTSDDGTTFTKEEIATGP